MSFLSERRYISVTAIVAAGEVMLMSTADPVW